MSTEMIKVSYENDRPTVLARDLHDFLEVETPYHKWFPRMCEYGFTEGQDYVTADKNVLRADGAKMPQIQTDAQLTIEMAKEICMLQRNDKGKKARQYFIELEKKWNDPTFVMARALKVADQQIKAMTQQIAEMKPKAEFADTVADSRGALNMGEFAKIVHTTYPNMGRNKLLAFLRDQKILTKGNIPYQKFVNANYFRVIESVKGGNGVNFNQVSTLILPKGQFFILDLLKKSECSEPSVVNA